MTTKNLFLLVLLLFAISSKHVFSQTLTQSIRGVVTDKNLQIPIEGAHVVLLSDSTKSTTTNSHGEFVIPNVPVGRHAIKVSHISYVETVLPNLSLTSGKELVVTIMMESQVKTLRAVSVKEKTQKNKPLNDMSLLSARTFSVEETQKFAAAVNDPARMATSFAGVVGADDGNNTIVIRGNAPSGLLWRMEGIDIPGPNHYSSFNGASGGISILSAQLLSNSDFLTGAFSAEYGNALSGVFDLKLRRGNKEKREYTFQSGILGIDFAAEGPLSKKGGSYLVNYRYSTLSVLQIMGVNIGPATYKFQDLSFNIAFPRFKAGQFTFFGFGGLSSQDFKAKKDSLSWEVISDKYSYFFGSNTGATGITHFARVGNRSSIKNVILLSGNTITDKGDFYNNNYVRITAWDNAISNSKLSFSSTFNHQFNDRTHLRAGFLLHRWWFNANQRERDTIEVLRTYLDNKGSSEYAQAFAQIKHKLSGKLSAIVGVHSLYLNLNKKISLEPRAAMRYDLNKRQSVTLGYGLHSQLQLPGLYFAQSEDANGNIIYPNKNLDFNKAHHFVLGYDRSLNPYMRLKIETYYQSLFHIPVLNDPNSTFSMANIQFGYIANPMVNEGKGRNYGLEFTIERFLHKGMYYLVSASVYNSEYKTLSNKWYNTKFNGKHALTVTAGKEIEFQNNKKVLGFNFKTSWYGGYRETPIDLEKSRQYKQAVYRETEPFTHRIPSYFRTDIRISYRINHKKYSSIWSLDLQNATNRKNVGGMFYDVDKGEIKTFYMTPLLPILSYKIEF